MTGDVNKYVKEVTISYTTDSSQKEPFYSINLEKTAVPYWQQLSLGYHADSELYIW